MKKISRTWLVIAFCLKLTLECCGQSVLLTVVENNCITNTSSAMAAVYELNDGRLNTKKARLSERVRYAGNDQKRLCGSFSDCYYSGDKWATKSSLEMGPIDNLITDRRLEDISTHITNYVDGNNKDDLLQYVKVAEIKESDFVVPFSVQIAYEGHVFLCHGEVTESRCYWFMLMAWSGTKSGFRKCKSEQIYGKNPTVYPKNYCFASTRSWLLANFLAKDRWSHFKIIRTGTQLKLTNNLGRVLMEIDVNDFNFEPRYMYVHSKSVNGLWKVHNFEYFYSDVEGNTRFKLKSSRGHRCLSVFVAMCSRCSMQIEFLTYKSWYTWNQLGKRSLTGKGEKWHEERFCIDVDEDYLYLGIKKTSNGLSTRTKGHFWALSDIQVGNEGGDLRILTPDKETWTGTCEDLEIGRTLSTDFEKTETFGNGGACNENEFGENCIPCGAVFEKDGSCPQTGRYCQLVKHATGEIGTKCFCQIGRQGSRCKDVCEDRTYGHGCLRSCDHCMYGCDDDPISGKCNNPGYCFDNYQGEKCDIPLGLFLFDDLPEITIDFTKIRLVLRSFKGKGNLTRTKYYKFQYKQKGTDDWKEVTDQPLQFNHTQEVVLDKLVPQTTYEVRAFGFGKDDDLTHLSYVFPQTLNFTTDCKDLDLTTTLIRPESYLVKIFVNKTENLCNIADYSMSIGDKPLRNEGNEMYVLEDLEPYVQYTLRVMKNGRELFTEQFRTAEARPDKVGGLRVPRGSSAVTWSKPAKMNGNLLFYTVTAQLKSLFACKNSMRTTNETYYVGPDGSSFSLSNLRPYAHYQLEIKANTSAGFGEPALIDVYTPAVDEASDYEIPQLTEAEPEANNVRFRFDVANCERLRGPLKIEIDLQGTDSWCRHTELTEVDKLLPEIKILSLRPFCNYSATFKYKRYGKLQQQTTTSFTTHHSAPNVVNELLVTSKGSHYVELRWRPPYPPTGELEGYQIEVGAYGYNTWSGKQRWVKNETIHLSSCDFWPNFHCATVDGLEEYFVYTLTVRAKNKDVATHSEGVSLKVQAREKEPERPYGLKTSWTDENHLRVQWLHPNATNGRLTDFQVNVTYEGAPNRRITLNEPISEHKPTYTATIKDQLVFPEQYEVAVKVRNSRGYSDITSLAGIESPPPIPQDYVTEINRTNHSITVTILMKGFRNTFKCFLYALISECDTCQEMLLQFEATLKDHHKSSDILDKIIPVNNWKRLVSYTYTNSDDKKETLTISNLGRANYFIEKGTKYAIAFIWIHKHQGYIRSNRTIRFSQPENASVTRSFNVGNALIALFFVIALIASLTFVWYKKRARNMFTAPGVNRRSRGEAAEPTYENLSLAPIKSRRQSTRSLRPLSVLICEEICPGVPLFKTMHSRRIKLENFDGYVKNAIQSEELKSQHQTFPRGQTKEWTCGTTPENKDKNRYKNLIAYDHTRVVLKKTDSLSDRSDYINANFIDGYRQPRAYIATQGPKKNTVEDFWHMIWQEKATLIVMLANVIEGNKVKSEKYWPDVNEEVCYGNYRICSVDCEVRANYDYRRFELQYKHEKPRQVGQLHFKVWPDHGVPLYPQSLVALLKRMLLTKNFPTVVHCSAGVGRTGTIILCDICLRMAAAEGYVDVFAMLEHVRSQRPNMVDNIEQYKLAHLVILNCMTGLNTNIPITEDFAKTIREDVDVKLQLNYIKTCEWQDDAMKTVAFVDEDRPLIVPKKNRFPYIVPDDVTRVFLHPYPPNCPDPASTYINAVRVNGFCQPDRFLVTQFPLPNTIGDFWRLVAERDISFVVCLNEIPNKDPTCKPFWPKQFNKIQPAEVVAVRHVNSEDFDTFSIITLELSTFYEYQENERRTVKIAKFHGWEYPTQVPDAHFTMFVEDVTQRGRNSKQVLVTCYDGATASGLFIATSFVIEKIKLEQECDVCQAARSIRTSRKEFVDSKEQLEFLYKASVLYVEEKFFQYSNIQ